MPEHPWKVGTATGIGSMPGTDANEAAAIVAGELPEFPHLAELPARGVGADLLGRTAALLVNLAVEVVPSGYRVVARPGHEHRRAVDLLRWDLDTFEQALPSARPEVVKVQLAGPWTLTAGIELPRGHRVLTDRGALREFTESMVEGAVAHITEVAKRTGATVVVQLDEPGLPAVLGGALSTPSGYGRVPAVPEPDARDVLRSVIEPLERVSGAPVIVHCCAPRPPLALLRAAGASALAVDATELGSTTDGALLDQFGEALDADVVFFFGVVPGVDPGHPLELRAVADPVLSLFSRLGFDRSALRAQAVATPACGLAGASAGWARRSLGLARDAGRVFAEPPEGW